MFSLDELIIFRQTLPPKQQISHRNRQIEMFKFALFIFLLACSFVPASAQNNSTQPDLIYTGASIFGTSPTTTVNGYSTGQTTGTLTPLASTPFAAGGYVLSIAAHPSGNFLYVATTTPSATQIEGFTIDALTGGLTPISGSPFQVSAASPAVLGQQLIAISPSGNYLYLRQSGKQRYKCLHDQCGDRGPDCDIGNISRRKSPGHSAQWRLPLRGR